MVVEQQGHDIARRPRVARGVGAGGQLRTHLAAQPGVAREILGRLAGDVAPVTEPAGPAGDVPAAPAFRQRGVRRDVGAARAGERFAGRVREDRARAQRGGVIMVRVAEQALLAARDQRRGLRLLRVEHVEGRAQHGVEDGDLDGAAGHPADVGLVGEIQRAGIDGRDEPALQAGLAEDEQLGFHGHLQTLEQPAQPASRGPAADLLRLRRHGRVQAGDGVHRHRRRVADRRVLEGLVVLGAEGSAQRQRGGQQEDGAAESHDVDHGDPRRRGKTAHARPRVSRPPCGRG